MSVPEGQATWKNPEDQEAGEIVAAHLGGTVCPREAGGGREPETHDLDVVLPDGSLIAVEVTSASEEPLESFARAAGRCYPAPDLSYDWLVGLPVDGTIRVKDVLSEAAPQLRVVELAGRESVGGVLPAERRVPADASEDEARAIQALFDLGVDSATRGGRPDARRPAELLVSPLGGASSDFADLYDRLEDRAEAKVSKLIGAKASRADQAHLFIWVFGSASNAELTLHRLPPPSVPPQLPAGIDALWLASRARVPHGRLWVLRPPGGWEDLTWGRHV